MELMNTQEYLIQSSYITTRTSLPPVSYTHHIDESCLDCHIIKLVFQPFIENSIKHGFNGIPSGGSIFFCVKAGEKDLLITIADNGKGMETSEFEKLSAKLEKDDFDDFQDQNESIGILNIHYRLKLKFGAAYHLTISHLLILTISCRIYHLPAEKQSQNLLPANNSR